MLKVHRQCPSSLCQGVQVSQVHSSSLKLHPLVICPWVTSFRVLIASILQFQSLSLPADTNKKINIISLSHIDSPPASLSDLVFRVTSQPRHLYAVGRTILLTSCGQAFWEVVSFWLIGIKKSSFKKRKLGGTRTPSAACCWYKHYVMLRLLPVTIGRANSTKSSMRTGQAPEEGEKQWALVKSSCFHSAECAIIYPAII